MLNRNLHSSYDESIPVALTISASTPCLPLEAPVVALVMTILVVVVVVIVILVLVILMAKDTVSVKF